MKGKLKKILSMCIVTLLIFMTCGQVASYAVTFFAYQKRADNKKYFYNGNAVFDYEKDSTNNYVNDYYCLEGGAHIGNATSDQSESGYTKYGILGKNASTVEAATGIKLMSNVTYGKYKITTKDQSLNALKFLVRNMYMVSSSNNGTQRDRMKEHLNSIISHYTGTVIDLKAAFKNGSDDEFIGTIQQFVIWKFVKPLNSENYYQKSITKESDLNNIYRMNGSTKESLSALQVKCGYLLYDALCKSAMDYGVNKNSTYEMVETKNEKCEINYKNNSKKSISLVSENISSNQYTYKTDPVKLTFKNVESLTPTFTSGDINITSWELMDASKNTKVNKNLAGLSSSNGVYVQFTTNEKIIDTKNNTSFKLSYKGSYKSSIKSYEANVYYKSNKQPLLEMAKVIEKKSINDSINFNYKADEFTFDLALTKEITAVYRYNKTKNTYDIVYNEDRSNNPDNSVLNKRTTAKYVMNKTPVNVMTGDIIRYKLTIYNEGDTPGLVTQVKDYLPDGLEYVKVGNGLSYETAKAEKKYLQSNAYNNEHNRVDLSDPKVIRFKASDNAEYIKVAANGGSNTISFECKVTNNVTPGTVLRNIAAISEYGYKDDDEAGTFIKSTLSNRANKNIQIDRDSEQNNMTTYNEFNASINRNIQENNVNDLEFIDKYNCVDQDDEDFEQVKVGGFDLALRKFVNAVFDEKGNQVTIASRTPRFYSDTTTHFNDGGTTALYYHKKVPISVKNNYIIRYKIRIYNEGYIPGYATKVVDYLPEGLELIENDSENIANKWQKSSDGRTIYTEMLKDKLINPACETLGFSELMNDDARENDLNPGFFKDIILKCKVNYTGNNKQVYLTNVAEIQSSKYVKATEINQNGDITTTEITNEDRDSTGNNVFTKVSNVKNVDQYRQAKDEGRKNKGYKKGIWYDGDNKYYGVEDDDDFENLIIYNDFDLALRKFITKVGDVNVDGDKDRTPLIDEESINALKKDSTAIYKHPKNAIEVKTGSNVNYILRIFNESTTAGVVKEVVDYIPDGMELVAGNGWSYAKVNGQNVKVGNYTKIVYTPSAQLTVNSPGADGYENLKNAIKTNGSSAYSQFNNKFWIDIPLTCKITSTNDGEILCNIAEITKYGYESTEATSEGIDRDSIQNNVFSNEDTPENYIDEHYKEGNEIFTGEEDDDDFESIKVVSKHNFDIELEKTDENGTRINGTKFEITQYETGNPPAAAIESGAVGGTQKKILENTEVINGSVTKTVNEITSNKNYFYKVNEVEGIEGYLNILEGYTILIPVHVDNDGNLELVCRYSSREEDVWKPTKGFIILDDNNTKLSETDELYEKVSVGLDANKVKISVKNPKIEGFYRFQVWKKDEVNNYIKGIGINAERIENYVDANNDGIDDNGKTSTIIFNNKKTNSSGYVVKNGINIDSAGVDKYTVTEIIDPTNEYIELKDSISLYVQKEEVEGEYRATKVSFDNNEFSNIEWLRNVPLSDNKGTVDINVQLKENADKGNVVQFVITNPKITGAYNLQIEKLGEDDTTKLKGVVFSAKDKNEELLGEEFTTNANGLVQIVDKTIEEVTTDWYDITEINVGNNQYIKLDESVRVYVETAIAEDGNSYKVNRISFNPIEDTEDEQAEVVLDRTIELPGGYDPVEAHLALNENTITLTIHNRKYEGQYILRAQKVDEDNNIVAGISFEVEEEDGTKYQTKKTSVNGTSVVVTKTITEDNLNDVDKYTIKEVKLNGTSYVQLDEEITFYVHKKLADGIKYKATSVSFDENEIGSADEKLQGVKLKGNKGTVDVRAYIQKNYVDIIIPNKEIEGKYGIELVKTKEDKTTALPGVTFTVTKGEGENAETVVDKQSTSSDGKITIIPNETEITTNDLGQEVYTITENSTDSRYLKITNEIKLYVTKGLNSDETEYVVTNASFASDSEKLETDVTLADGTILKANVTIENGVVKVTVPNKEIKGNYGLQIVKTGENDEPLKDVEFTITEGEETSAKDITPENNKTNEEGKLTVFTKETRNITSNDVNTKDVYTIEEIKVNDSYVALPRPLTIYVTKGLNSNKTAYIAKQASFSKENLETTQDISLPNGKIATVSLNVQNSLVTVTIPNHKIEGKYDLELIKIDQKDGESVLPGVTFDIKTMKGTEEVKLYNTNGEEIDTKGLTTNSEGKIILPNVKITEGARYNFEITETKVPNGYVMLKDKIVLSFNTKVDNETQNYVLDEATVNGVAELESASNKLTVKVQNGQFDLALRKYISGVTVSAGNSDEKKITLPNRVPVFKVNENGEYIYEHSKDTVLLGNQNVVEYTLRVYNEGSISGYAKEIKDDIPEGLEFLPEDNTNKKYGWKLLDEEGNEVKEVNKAKYIASNYLSKEQEENEEDNLLKAFNTKEYAEGKVKEPDYKEVKVAFKVIIPNTDDRIIINKAQISDDSDKDGNDITDKDSTPDEWIDGEDDQDIEKIKVQYFDLALRKWVSKAIVIEDGKETVTETGHKPEDDPEEIVKVDLKDSKINKVVVKFEYKIRVTNEGEIAGTAKEISDYIPEGLRFDLSDNPNWKEVEGKIVTEELKDTILAPGESKDVTVILTWINRKDNLGLKQNIAEISKDYNIYGSPDIDSVPDNKVPGEDDLDDAPVMLTVKTGQAVTFVGLTIAVIAILGSGIILIKKYVIK